MSSSLGRALHPPLSGYIPVILIFSKLKPEPLALCITPIPFTKSLLLCSCASSSLPLSLSPSLPLSLSPSLPPSLHPSLPLSLPVRQWIYQTCTEFGYFQTTDSPNQPFGDLIPLSSFTDICSLVFNISTDALNDSIARTNAYYGGKNISKNATNIVFPNGSIDPWHALGITQSMSESLPAIYIDGTAHCANMYPPAPKDPQGLVDARTRITELIGTWLEAAK